MRACLPLMPAGGIITGYMARPIAITVPGVVVESTTCAVQVPQNCPYFPYQRACVPVITVANRAARKKRKLELAVAQSLGLA